MIKELILKHWEAIPATVLIIVAFRIGRFIVKKTPTQVDDKFLAKITKYTDAAIDIFNAVERTSILTKMSSTAKLQSGLSEFISLYKREGGGLPEKTAIELFKNITSTMAKSLKTNVVVSEKLRHEVNQIKKKI